LPVKPSYLALAGAGAIVAVSGLKGWGLGHTFRDLVSGNKPGQQDIQLTSAITAASFYGYGTNTGGGGGPIPKGKGPARWPFPVKNIPQQSRRIDQGWDLQYPGTRPVPVYAVLSGTVALSSDPNGFGVSYPIVTLDNPVSGGPAIYYGHVFPLPGIGGKHVRAGQAIARTGGMHSGGNAYNDPNWLEIGFWNNGPTGDGAAMKAFLGG
jgi:hypothetical protein